MHAQSRLTHCDPLGCNPPGSSVHGIFQARILEWAAISSSRGSSQPRDRTQVSYIAGRFFYHLSHESSGFNKHQFSSVQSLSRVRLFEKLWTVARQAPLSMGFSRQQYWSGLPFPTPGDLPNPGIEPASPALAGKFFITEP